MGVLPSNLLFMEVNNAGEERNGKSFFGLVAVVMVGVFGGNGDSTLDIIAENKFRAFCS